MYDLKSNQPPALNFDTTITKIHKFLLEKIQNLKEQITLHSFTNDNIIQIRDLVANFFKGNWPIIKTYNLEDIFIVLLTTILKA